MAARNFGNEIHVAQPRLTELFIKATGNGTSNMTATYGLGCSPTISRSSAGVYVITLTDKWAALMDWSYSIQDSGTATDSYTVKLTAETVASNKTVTIQVLKETAAAHAVTADLSSSQILTLRLVLLDSSALPVKGA